MTSGAQTLILTKLSNESPNTTSSSDGVMGASLAQNKGGKYF